MELQTDNFDYSYFYRALVVDNADPDKLGRIKVRIQGIFKSDIPANQLPWATPASSVFTGSGVGYGNFAVPEIGSYVFVFFEGRDVYQPVYFAEALDGVHGLPSERITNYPSRKVQKTKNGIVLYIDDSSKEIKINHPSGAYILIDGSGNIQIKGTTIHLNP